MSQSHEFAPAGPSVDPRTCGGYPRTIPFSEGARCRRSAKPDVVLPHPSEVLEYRAMAAPIAISLAKGDLFAGGEID